MKIQRIYWDLQLFFRDLLQRDESDLIQEDLDSSSGSEGT